MFIVLQNGLYLDDISFPNIKAKQLYIKWNEKINIAVKELHVETSNKTSSPKIDYTEIGKYLNKITLLDSLIEKVQIQHIIYNDINGSFNYIENENGFLNISSPSFKLKSSLFFERNLLNIKIDKLNAFNNNIKINGNIIIDTDDKLELISSLMLKVNNEIDLKLYANTNTSKLTYKIEANKNIQSIKKIIDNFAPNWEAKWWVRDAINMSSLTLNNAYGWLEYDNIDDAYKNVHVEATVNNLKYTYDENLDVIDTSHTELEFKNGVLHIRPKNAYTYGFFLDASWLNIDFTKSEVLINLYLNFKGTLNKDLLYLLKNYHIDLPFIQNRGELKTDLKLVINLRTTDVEAHGNFYTDDAQIHYLGLDIDVKKAEVILNNKEVEVKNMFASYEDMAKAYVDINFNGASDEGVLDFRLNEVSLKDLNLTLDESKKPIHVKYTISKKQDYLHVEESNWITNNEKVNIQALKIPFDINTLSANIPKTLAKSEKLSGYISGKMLFDPIRLNLNIDLLKFNNYGYTLKNQAPKLNLIYNNNISIKALDEIELKSILHTYMINDLDININSGIVDIKNTRIDIDSLLKSSINMHYNLNAKNGFIDLNRIYIKSDTLGEIFKDNNHSKIYIKNNNHETIISSKKYNMSLTIDDYQQILKVNSLLALSKSSTLMQSYSLDNGSFVMNKKYNDKYMRFKLESEYKYKMLVENNNPISKYTLYGKIDTNNENLSININNLVNMHIADDIKITTKNIGLDVSEITDMISNIQSTGNSDDSKDVYFNATNAYVYISQRRHVLSDTIYFDYKDNVLSAELKYAKGISKFKFQDNKFSLSGKNFNDTFMNELFDLSKFKGGTLGFSMGGFTDEYKGVMYIKDSTIIDYKILNNILAFINTVPSLVTFSLPNYNKKGLLIDRSYLDFNLKNDIYNMKNINLTSKELKILGKGELSIKNNTIDIDLNLKTNLGSSMSKIPLVGYIIFGDETVSTSLTLNGKLDNPVVNTQVSKDIIVAPWNIVKRTFTYPLRLFKSDEDK